MTPAQKKNAVKFKEAIAIRKKTGCSLKEAFAKVYGKTKAAPKKAAKKKVGNVTLKKANYHARDERYVIMNDGKQHLEGKAFFKADAKDIAKALRRVKAKIKAETKKVSGVKKAPKKKAVKKAATHKDTKSHNVNIRVMSGNKSLGAYKLNPFTFTQLKKLNPLYFQNGWETWFGVKGKKIISSNKLGCQVYVEKINRPYLGIHYTCRKISREGTLGDLRRFHDISELEKHVDKYIKF